MSSFFHRASRFVAILLTTWTACDGAFQTPYCEYFADREECQSKSPMNVEDMGKDIIPPLPSTPPVKMMKGPIGFAYATSASINNIRNWVGIHQGNRLVFADQESTNARIMNFTLKPSSGQSWSLESYTLCDSCLKLFDNFISTRDYIITSRSLFYKITPGTPGTAIYSPNQDQNNFTYITVNKAIAGYRPFANADYDAMIFQLGKSANHNDQSGSAFVYQSNSQTPDTQSFSINVNYDKPNLDNKNYVTYCVGDLDQLETALLRQEVLTFEGSAIADAYHIKIDSGKTIMESDNDLKTLIALLRSEINTKFKIDSTKLIRSAYIADLNNDKYADLLIGILNHIYVATYIPETRKFILWATPIVSLDGTERPRSITVSDLNGDSYPDLAVEIFNDTVSDYRNETPLKVSFYINKQM